MASVASSPPRVVVNLPRLFTGQRDVLQFLVNGGKGAVVFGARRYGKTQVGVYTLLGCASQRVGLYWWVGLSWRSASMKRAWRLLKLYTRRMWKALGDLPDKIIREAEKELTLPNGSVIWMRTAENPDSLAGESVSGVVMDEFTLMNADVWPEFVEGTLADREGWALFIGVPKGKNWAFHLWSGANGRKNWRAFHFTTYDNPRISREWLEETRLHTPEHFFRQEYLAEVMDDSGTVFRTISGAMTSPLLGHIRHFDHRYVAGVDWGKDNDYTVMAVMDATTRQMVDFVRFNRLDWTTQRGRIVEMVRRWGIELTVAERNSIGDPIIEELAKELRQLGTNPNIQSPNIQGFQTTHDSKGQIIEALALAIEQQAISLQPLDVLRGELEAYTMERLPSGTYRYNAPSGLHDDCVIAVALMWYAATQRRGVLVG